VLSTAEGQQLADFLNDGGSLYMEGADTWAYDSPTAVHPMFNITGLADGSSDLDSLQGIPGTETEGLSFNYTGENSYIDRLAAVSPAFTLLDNNNPVYSSCIAHDAGAYQTIGASHEFVGIEQNNFSKIQLMGVYLRFFNIPISSEWVGVNSDWNDPANWSNGLVPDPNTLVSIPVNPSRGGYPTENSSDEGHCKSLKIEPGAMFNIPAGTTIYVHAQ
jgi:hypothetical protein